MKRIKTLAVLGFLCGLLLPSMLSCKKNSNELPVEFQLRVLDTLGIEKSVFTQGENIVFSFLVVNNSTKDILLENFLPNDELFMLYQFVSNEELVPYGKPYDAICETGLFAIPAKGSLEFKCPWVSSENTNYYGYCLGITSNSPSNTLLPIGNFITSFSSAFKIDDIQTEVQHFEVKFSVK